MQNILKIISRLFTLLGIVFFMAIIGGILLLQHFAHRDEVKIPDRFTLALTLAEPMTETAPRFIRSLSGSAPPSLQDWIVALESAVKDDRVSGVIIRAVGGGVNLTQAEELRASIARLRAANKPVFFFADSFGEGDNGTAMAYLAASATKTILQPGGFAGFLGIAIEQPFFRDLLDEYGVLPESEKRRTYKSAMDNLTEAHMTAPDREQLTRLLTHLSDTVMQSVAADRKIPLEKLVALRDASPLAANDDASKMLIDQVAYEDQITLPAPPLDWDVYLSNLHDPKSSDKAPRIALVNAEGQIARGTGGNNVIGAEDFVALLQEIEKEKEIRAVIIRLNSPGGSAIASETINRAIQRLRDTGRPVIVSMTQVAASGGYYMAAPATRILALPSTLTGSIGVIAGKVSIGGLSQKYNVNWDEIAVGKNAGLFATGRGMNADERVALARSADYIYDTFKSRVAAGRKLSPETVEAIAQGQVWTGAEAKANGLVDQIGGFVAAVDVARAELHLAANAPVQVDTYDNNQGPAAFIQYLLRQWGVVDRTIIQSLLHETLQALVRPPALLAPPVQVLP